MYAGKGISSIVVLTLLVLVSVVSVYQFQQWVSIPISESLAEVEQKEFDVVTIDGIYGSSLYLRSKKKTNITINQLDINGVSCLENRTYDSKRVIVEGVGNCSSHLKNGRNQIMVITKDGIVTKEIFIPREKVNQIKQAMAPEQTVEQISITSPEEWRRGTLNATTAKTGELSLGYENRSEPSLVSYWSFDTVIQGTNGVINDSIGNNSATTEGGVSTNNSGVFGSNTYRYLGDDERLRSDADYGVFDFRANASYSWWMKTSDDTGQYFGIIGSHQPSGSYRGWAFANSNGGFSFWSDTSKWQKPNIPIADGRWHHYVATIDGSTLLLYKNGSQVASLSYQPPTEESIDFFIGDRNNLEGNPFTGKIDELRIYNTTLNTEEIEALYLNGAPFSGTYVSEQLGENLASKTWISLNITAHVPADTTLSGRIHIEDDQGSLLDQQSFTIPNGTSRIPLNLSTGPYARVSFEGNTTDPERSWEISRYALNYTE